MNCSLAERIMATGREETAPVPPLVAWVRRHLPDAAVWPPQRGRGEKDPSSDPEKQACALRLFVLHIGTARIGPPSEEVRAAIEAMTDIGQLEAWMHRLMLGVESWDELLAGQTSTAPDGSTLDP